MSQNHRAARKQRVRFRLLLLLPAAILLLVLIILKVKFPDNSAEVLLSQPPDTGVQIQYGVSESGRALHAYHYGEGENVMVLTFCCHGYEDRFDRDGMALVETAYTLMQALPDWELTGWTVYVLPCLNPDGLCDGDTAYGPGRCNAAGLDINRCFPAGWTALTEPRYRNGSAPLQSAEAAALADFLQQVQGDGENFCIDVHGWYQQILTSDGQNGALWDAFSAQFPENTWADVRNGAGYLTAYAAQLGYHACLFEFPADADCLAQFLGSDARQQFLAAVRKLLEAAP